MRRLCRVMVGGLLCAAVVVGCGSTSNDDNQVMRFVGFDGNGIAQNDIVSPTSAVVCVSDPSLPPDPDKPITPTQINAIFINEEKANIHMNTYTVHFNDARAGVGDVNASITSNPDLPGGTCSSSNDSCAVAADCFLSGGSGTGAATCDHTATTVGGIILIDNDTKSHVPKRLFGQTLSVSVAFVGVDDVNRTFQVVAGYVITFDDSPTCGQTTNPTPGTPMVTPLATATATATATVAEATPTPGV